MSRSTTTVDRHGRIVIPAEFRRALGLHEGDELSVTLEAGTLKLMTRAAAVTRAQDMVAARTRGERSLVQELLAERRAESARD